MHGRQPAPFAHKGYETHNVCFFKGESLLSARGAQRIEAEIPQGAVKPLPRNWSGKPGFLRSKKCAHIFYLVVIWRRNKKMKDTQRGRETSVLPVMVFAIAVSIASGILTLFIGCGEQRAAAVEEMVYSVRTVRAEIRDMQEYFETGGDVITETSVEVFPDIGGRLLRLHAGLGDFVRKGEIIAEVDPSKPGLRYAPSPVRSPISGTITEVLGKAGATVEASSAIARMGQIERIEVKVLIPEKEMGRVRPGQRAAVSFEAFPGEVFPAKVSRQSPVVDPATRAREIRLVFTGNASRVCVGMFARVTIYTALHAGLRVIPESALGFGAGGRSVFVVTPQGRAEERAVGTGISLDGFTEITEGLEAGSMVVSEGQNLLSDGVKLRVLSGAAP
jgi:multidrug efflux pump subunit AcrA (membrane-fusion protein)